MVKTRGSSGAGQTKHQGRAPADQAAGKARNKVAATKPVKSPELQSSSGKGQTGDDSSVSSGSVSSTASRPGIPFHVQKQLAIDIEGAGGISSFKENETSSEQVLSKLCDDRPETYGARGSQLRTQIRKKVWYWRQQDKEGKYVERVLNRFGVQSAANLKKVANRNSLDPASSNLSDEKKKRPAGKGISSNKKKQPKSPSSSSSSASKSSSSVSSLGSDHAVRASAAAASKKNPPTVIGITKTGGKQSSSHRASGTPPPRTDKELPASTQTCEAIMATSRASPPKPSGCEVIPVNLDCPEANREFLIYPVHDIPGVEKEGKPITMYYGYFILLPADKRWYQDSREVEHYKARVFGSNQVLVTIPAFDYTMLYNQDEVKEETARFPVFAVNAIDNACHEFDKNKMNRQYKHFLLQFPSDHRLSASVIFDKATEDEYLPLIFHPVEVPGKKGKTTKRLYASFTVANEAVTAQKRGKVEHKPKESDGARQLDELESDSDEGLKPKPKPPRPKPSQQASGAGAASFQPGLGRGVVLQCGLGQGAASSSTALSRGAVSSSTPLVPQAATSLQRASAVAASDRLDSELGRLLTEGESMVSEGHGIMDSIMNDETAHKKRTSPQGGKPDDADAATYDRTHPPVKEESDIDDDDL